jgi:hypothetical protein
MIFCLRTLLQAIALSSDALCLSICLPWTTTTIFYVTHIHPLQTIERGLLSRVQLETLAYAKWRFGQDLQDGSRAGIFLGDGAGMGKGRTIAGLVLEAYVDCSFTLITNIHADNSHHFFTPIAMRARIRTCHSLYCNHNIHCSSLHSNETTFLLSSP